MKKASGTLGAAARGRGRAKSTCSTRRAESYNALTRCRLTSTSAGVYSGQPRRGVARSLDSARRLRAWSMGAKEVLVLSWLRNVLDGTGQLRRWSVAAVDGRPAADSVDHGGLLLSDARRWSQPRCCCWSPASGIRRHGLLEAASRAAPADLSQLIASWRAVAAVIARGWSGVDGGAA